MNTYTNKHFKCTLHINYLSFFLCLVVLFISSCKKDVNENSDVQGISNVQMGTQKIAGSVATDWYHLQLRMISQNPPIPPNVAIRLFSYSSVSLFEAARFAIPNSISLQHQLYQMPVMPLPDSNRKYSWIITANAAMASITRDLFPGITQANRASIDSLENAYNIVITGQTNAAVVVRSQAFGDSVAALIFNWSKSDLFDHINDPYIPPVGMGLWVPTPPAFAPATAPYQGNVRPFLRSHLSGTTIAPAYRYSEEKSSDFFKMANNVYKISKSLTDDQKNIALFWNDAGPGSYTGQGHDLSIITQVLENSNASLGTAEEIYVKAGIAMWDAGIVCFRSKYKYNLLRPVTYIRKNIDTAWLPFLTTPPHPEYPAAHAYVTSSTMEVMSTLYGNKYGFTDHTYDFRGFPTRAYKSFEDAALECGESRVYGGIHYQQSVDISHVYGQLIGKDAAAVQIMNKN